MICYSILLGLVTVVSIIGNTSVLVKVATTRKLRTVPNLLTSMVSAVMLVECFTYIPLKIHMNSLNEGDWITKSFCVAMSTLRLSIDILSLTLFALIALNRYVKITKGDEMYKRLFNKISTGLIVTGSSILSLGLAMLQLLMDESLHFDETFMICIVQSHDAQHVHNYLFIILLFIIAAMVIPAVSYCKIGLFYRAVQHRLSITGSHHNKRRDYRVYALCVLNASFLLTWMPNLVLFSIYLETNISISSSTVAAFFLISSSKHMLFPVMYLYMAR